MFPPSLSLSSPFFFPERNLMHGCTQYTHNYTGAFTFIFICAYIVLCDCVSTLPVNTDMLGWSAMCIGWSQDFFMILMAFQGVPDDFVMLHLFRSAHALRALRTCRLFKGLRVLLNLVVPVQGIMVRLFRPKSKSVRMVLNPWGPPRLI